MDSKLQYIVILTFPEEIQREIKSLRDKYNNVLSQIVPHITLKQPFYLLIAESLIKEKLQEVAESVPKFTIEMNGLSYFEGEKNTAYIALKNKTSTMDLHKKIVYALQGKINEVHKESYELDCFIPHASIGEHLSNADIEKIKQELSSYNPTHAVPMDSFSLFSANENLQWEPVEKFELK